MSIRLMTQVWDIQSLTQPRKMLLLALADNANDEGRCWPSVETLMRKCGFRSESGVRAAIKELAEKEWLTKLARSEKAENGRRKQASNLYILNLKKLRSESDIPPNKDEGAPHDGSYHDGSCGERSCHDPSCDTQNSSYEGAPYAPKPSLKQEPSIKHIKHSCPVSAKPDPDDPTTVLATQVLTHLNEQTGSRYRPVKSSLENIKARLRESFSIDELKLVIDYSIEKWGEDMEMASYLNPETLFRPKKFAGYLQSASKWHKAGRPQRMFWSNWRKHSNLHRVKPATNEIPKGFMGPEEYIQKSRGASC